MAYKVVTAVTVYPVTLTEARLHLKASDDTTEDALIESWIAAAFEFAEHYTGRALAPQTLEQALDEFPDDGGVIMLDMPPVTSVTSIKYTDTAGVEQTLATSGYALKTRSTTPREIALTYGSTWPSTQDVAEAVRILYVTGDATATQTSAVKAAILLLIGHLYEHRQDVSAIKMEEIPMGARSLLDTVKVWGF